MTHRVEAGEQPGGLSAGDVDGDGRLDLVIANHDTDHVTVLFGGNHAAFERRSTSEQTVDVAPHPHATALADLDGDGLLDLFVDDRDRQGVRVFLGLGDGTFGSGTAIPTGGDPYRGFQLVDVDADGATDLLSPNPDHVAIVGARPTVEEPGVTLEPGFDPFAVITADVDGDGATDIVAGSGERTGLVSVWRATGSGGFAAPQTIEVATGPTQLAATDLDGDGADDVIVSSYVGSEITFSFSGDPSRLVRVPIDGAPWELATGDLDGDGDDDVAVANDAATAITILLWGD